MRPGKGEVFVNLVGKQPQIVARQSFGDASISSAVNTAPVGLCGLLIQMTRVRGVTAAAIASRSG